MTGTARRRGFIAAVVVLALPPSAAEAGGRPVARITALSGHALYAKRGSHLVRLHRGDTLRRGAWLVVGPKTSMRARVLLGRKSKIADGAHILVVTRYHSAKPPKVRKLVKDLAVDAGYAKYRPILRMTNASISLGSR